MEINGNKLIMYNVAIIGAGQLGSRHLQGLKTALSPLAIFVVDSDEEMLLRAKARYEQVSPIGKKQVVFTTDMSELPSNLDLVIVATSSRPRASIVKTLLNSKDVKYLILEKVLFPTIEVYDEIRNLITEKNIKCWVNCPRRMYASYKDIADYIDKKLPITMSCEGGDWGLCCNSIHYIDLFMYLSGEQNYEINLTNIDNEIEESKRNGYIEMTGTINVNTSNDSKLKLTSIKNSTEPSKINIDNGNKHILIDKSKGVWKCGKEEFTFTMPYQSQLSGVFVDNILNNGKCELTEYEVSSTYHIPFISALLKKYNEIMKSPDNKILPIT